MTLGHERGQVTSNNLIRTQYSILDNLAGDTLHTFPLSLTLFGMNRPDDLHECISMLAREPGLHARLGTGELTWETGPLRARALHFHGFRALAGRP